MEKSLWEVSNPPPDQSRLTANLAQAQGLISFASLSLPRCKLIALVQARTSD